MINHSISIRPTDTESVELVKTIKEYCKNNGLSFSFIVLKLLKQNANEILNGKL